MSRPQLKVIEGGKASPIPISPVLAGYLIVSIVTFLYGLLIGFIVGRVWF